MPADRDRKALGLRIPGPARTALDRLAQAGYPSYLVGGALRDILLGRLVHDMDLATPAPAATVMQIFEDAGQRVIPTGLAHGTVTVLMDPATPVEITTFRSDGTYTDGRHPNAVSFVTSIEEDLARRDFTINALAWSPDRGLVDPYGGREDLQRGLIRAVGSPRARFSEDGLRVMRALRFSAQLGFALTPATARAVLDCKDMLRRVSAERIRTEYDALVAAPYAENVLRLYAPVICVFIPELAAAVGLDQHSRWHSYDVWEHTLRALRFAGPGTPGWVRHCIILHDIGKPATYSRDEAGHGHFYGHEAVGAATAQAILRRLRWPKDEARRICALIAVHDRPIEASSKSVRRMLAKLGSACNFDKAQQAELFSGLLMLKRSDAASHAPWTVTPRLEHLDAVERVFEDVLAHQLAFNLSDLAVSGSDILAAGVAPGPAVGQILQELLQGVLDGEIPNTKKGLMQRVHESLEERGFSGAGRVEAADAADCAGTDGEGGADGAGSADAADCAGGAGSAEA